MSTAQTLLELQELDLSLIRDAATLSDLPELRDLAKKRKAYLKLKSDARGLLARRKDVETDLADLDAEEARCRAAVDEAQSEADGADYHRIQDLEIRLSSLAKELDKVNFKRDAALESLESVEAEERRLEGLMKSLEKAMRSAADIARERATELKESMGVARARRAALAESLPPEQLARYESSSKRFKGLAVERLEGEVPSICRTALQSSSLSDLKRAGEVGECPYCHRILVMIPEGEE